jgi:hypothetical protein
MGPAPVGEPDDLESVVELAVGGLEEGLIESSGVVVGQLDANHDGATSYEGFGRAPHPTKRNASAGL